MKGISRLQHDHCCRHLKITLVYNFLGELLLNGLGSGKSSLNALLSNLFIAGVKFSFKILITRSIGMGISLILMIGLFSIVWLVVNPKPIIAIIGNNHNLILFLRQKKFLQNYWLTGIFLLFMNAVIFILTILLLYYIQFLSIPFIHMLVMLIGVVLSIYLWILINLSWQGESRDRLKIGVIGSSFYLFLTAWFIFKLVTLEPLFPGDDTFMASIGFFFGIIVTSVAFITCFILSGFSRRK